MMNYRNYSGNYYGTYSKRCNQNHKANCSRSTGSLPCYQVALMILGVFVSCALLIIGALA